MSFAGDDRAALAKPDPASLGSKRAGKSETSPKLRTPQDLVSIRGRKGSLPFVSPPADPDATAALSFKPGRSRLAYDRVAFAPNPLVSSPYPATPEYSYLYTASAIAASPPPLKNHSYRADNSYLLRPSPAYQMTAWAYRWNREPARQTAVNAVRTPSLESPAALRRPGQKIDADLSAGGMLPRDQQGLWRTSPILGDVLLEGTERR